MAKRTHAVKKEGFALRAVLMPVDILATIAEHLDMDDSGQVFKFLLLCHSARVALGPVLIRWYAQEYENPTPRLRNLLHDYWERRRTRYAYFSTPPADVAVDFALASFYMAHIARLEERWRINCTEADVSKHVIHHKLYLSGLELRDAFYLDSATQRFRPLKLLPGLRTVDMPVQRSELLALVRTILAQRRVAGQSDYKDAGNSLVLSALEDIKDVERLRVMAHSLINESLKTHKPHKQAPLCNAILNGRHLMDKTPGHEALHINMYRLRGDSTEKKTKALDMRHSRKWRAQALQKRLQAAPQANDALRRATTAAKQAVAAPPPTTTVVLEDSSVEEDPMSPAPVLIEKIVVPIVPQPALEMPFFFPMLEPPEDGMPSASSSVSEEDALHQAALDADAELFNQGWKEANDASLFSTPQSDGDFWL